MTSSREQHVGKGFRKPGSPSSLCSPNTKLAKAVRIPECQAGPVDKEERLLR